MHHITLFHQEFCEKRSVLPGYSGYEGVLGICCHRIPLGVGLKSGPISAPSVRSYNFYDKLPAEAAIADRYRYVHVTVLRK